jgi:hypothetical protein
MVTAGVGTITPIWWMPAAGGQAVRVIDGALNGAFAVVDRGIISSTCQVFASSSMTLPRVRHSC